MSLLSFENVKWLEDLFSQYLKNPSTVDPSWRHFFEGMAFGAMFSSSQGAGSPELKIHLLIEAYRQYGHLMARINPLATNQPTRPKELRLDSWGLSDQELDALFPSFGFTPEPEAPLQRIVEALERTYCGTVGVELAGEFDHPKLKTWLQEQIEPNFPLHLDNEERLDILHDLNRAELFETFLHMKFVGQKRFSLEGAETFIPMMRALIERGAALGVEEVAIGMAHRGRLNVLVNILHRSYASLFREFEDHYTSEEFEGTGDVKYHKGFSGRVSTRTGKEVLVTLAANSSSLESVDPIVEGFVRGKQEVKKETACVLPLLVHGDAAIAGQGVVYETLQLCKLRGYSTGGTIHIIINNQIGFTTLPKDGRSTHYCTEIGRAFGAPIFHVNAEDPEGCVRVSKLAIEMRKRFGCDVFIDLNCYRKYGHNESDEPAFTQPIEYTAIRKRRPIREIYTEKLIESQVLSSEQAASLAKEFSDTLHKALETKAHPPKAKLEEKLSPPPVQTGVPSEVLQSLAASFCRLPEGLEPHPKVKKLLQERLIMVQKGEAIDWGMGEHLALATLLHDGIHVRISGQDSRRGTFSHRHAIVVHQTKQESYFPLSHLEGKQALFDIFNSPLSEYGVLGFEFGYSCSHPHSLTIWEAQFGDFANGAQVVIDQYIAASEQKWNLSSNITLLLPHGYEGQGPEHSSARIERFLQLAGEDNLRIANCSTPAQLFHLLRRQALSPQKKPLILFTPKALLRHSQCVSPLSAFVEGSFQEILEEPHIDQAKRLLFCSGKIYYDLLTERDKQKRDDVSLIRIEQLYPLPKESLRAILKKTNGDVHWIQEEPSNMGAWEFIRPLFQEILGEKRNLMYIGRERSASPAVGTFAQHAEQLKRILAEAFRT